MSTGTDIQTQEPPKEKPLSQWVKMASVHERLVNSLGTVMPSEQFIAHALVSFSKPDIRSCTISSQLNTMMEMAALGVLPTLGQAALIAYWNSDLGQSEVKLMVQWQGLKAVMERHPDIKEVIPVLVHVKDRFAYVNGVVEHSFDPFDPERTINDLPDIRGGYLRIIYKDGRPDKYHFSTAAYIAKCRACAKPAKKSGKREVWEAWFEQQALKTVIREAYARRAVPIDPLAAGRMERMLESDDTLLGNDPQRPTLTSNGNDEPPAQLPPPRSKAEEMAARLEHDANANAGAIDTTITEPEPIKTDFAKEVYAATSINAVRMLVKLAQEELGFLPDTLRDLCLEREKAIEAQSKPTTPPAKAPSWNGGPDEKTAYTLSKLATADLETIAKMNKAITPSLVGEENYRNIQAAMTARERELQTPKQPEETADPFAEHEAVTMLRTVLADKQTAADFDDMARRWSEDSHDIDEPTYNAGVVVIQQARIAKGV